MGTERPKEVVMSHRNTGTYVLAAAVVAAALIVAGVPFAAILPFAALLICPLMMVFMMRGMSHHGGSARREAHRLDERR